MADRQEFLGQVQQQLEAWTRWLRDLDDLAVTSAKELRVDAEAQFRQRAEQVRELVQRGRTQWDRISAAGDEAWEGIAGHAEQTWTALKDSASALALQAPAANDPAPVEFATADRKPATRPKKRRVSARPRAVAKSKSRDVARKSAPSRKKRARKSVGKKAVGKQAVGKKATSRKATGRKAVSNRAVGKKARGQRKSAAPGRKAEGKTKRAARRKK